MTNEELRFQQLYIPQAHDKGKYAIGSAGHIRVIRYYVKGHRQPIGGIKRIFSLYCLFSGQTLFHSYVDRK